MGWKQIFVADQSFFKSLYEQSKAWGELSPLKLTNELFVYGAGVVVQSGDSGLKLSPDIQWSPLKCRIRGKFALWVSEGASAKLIVWFGWKKNGDYCNVDGSPMWGAVYEISSGTGAVDLHDFEAVIEGSKVTIYIDGSKWLEKTIDATPMHVVLGASIEGATGQAAVAFTEVYVEYYDWVEDIFLSMYDMMKYMIWIFMIAILIALVIRVFRGKKERGEKE